MKSPFKLIDLPQGYSVSWPGYEHVFCDNSLPKWRSLLGVLFDDLGLFEVCLAMTEWYEPGTNARLYYLKSTAFHITRPDWLLNLIPAGLITVGVKFDELSQAEKFIELMEQRLAWKRLGGSWA
jgi:hypothetical protein